MSNPLLLEKPNISDSLGINAEDDHDYILLKSSGNIFAWNAHVSAHNGSKKPIKNETARLIDNSSTASTKGSSGPTCQEKKDMDVKESINSSCFAEKKDEVDFGGSSTGGDQISTVPTEERFDSENSNKISKLNLITQEASEEDAEPEHDLIEQMETETETDTVTTKPSTSLLPEEEDYVIPAEPSQRQKARKSKKPKTPQSKCKNLYKTILLEIFKIFICLFNLNEPQYKKICGKIQISNEEWDGNVLKNKVQVTALENQENLNQQDFDKWLQKNKKALEKFLEDKRFSLFVPFYEEIMETKRYIKKDNPMDYFKTYKENTSQEHLKNLTKEGELICWILVVKFSLIWLPKGSPNEDMKLFPVKKDTVNMVYWMVTTRTGPKVKNLLKNFKEREHLRENLQGTFDVMEQSARKSYPQMRNLLDQIKRVDCYIPEPSLTVAGRIIEEVQCIPGKEKESISGLMQTHLAFEAFEESYYKDLGKVKSKRGFDLFGFNQEQGERYNLNTLSRDVPSCKMQIEYGEGSCESHGIVENEKEEEKTIRTKKNCVNGDGKRPQLSFTGAFEEEGMALNKKVKKR